MIIPKILNYIHFIFITFNIFEENSRYVTTTYATKPKYTGT